MTTAPRLRPLQAVLDELARTVPVLPPTQVPLADALGAVLAEPIVARTSAPAQALALRDGFAVASQELVGASAYSPVPLSHEPLRVGSGETLPPGTDAVLPEDCFVHTGPVWEALAGAGPGENAIRKAEDAHAGDILRKAGDPLRPLDLVLAQACGVERLTVRRARITVLGASSAMLAAIGPIAGAAICALRSTGEDADLLLIFGPVPPLADEQVLATGLALRPGEGTSVSRAGRSVVVRCPARLDAAFCVARALATPLVRHLTGQRPPVPWLKAPLTRKLASMVGIAELALLRRTETGLEPLAVGALPFAALGRAEAFVLIPPESEGHAAGETVEVERLANP